VRALRSPKAARPRRDLETVLLPLLKLLYAAGGRGASAMYMLLIILLILSQDAAFAANVHTVQLAEVPWFRERLLHRTSLGAPPCLGCRV